MNGTLWITAFFAGLLGSTHCLGMCGGITAALGGTAFGAVSRPWLPLVHNLARIVSYAAAGAIAGTLGVTAGWTVGGGHWSEILRLCTAFMVVVIGLNITFGSSGHVRWLRAPERWSAKLWRIVSPVALRWLPRSAFGRALGIGLLWGWLPCGLAYSALLAAAVAGSTVSGGATMLFFGLGTLPAMSGLGYLGARLPRAGSSSSRIVGACIVGCGLWTATLPITTLTGAHEHHDHVLSSH